MKFPITPYRRVGFDFGHPWNVNSDGGPYLCGYPEDHTGWDVRRNPSGSPQMEAGDPVYARYDGIIYNHTHDPRWGNGVVIEHDPIPGIPHWATCEWHVDHLLPDGAYVKEGEQVATIFDLGPNTHLHDSVWIGLISELTRRGALPHVDCNGVPAFPAGFVDPYKFTLDHQQEDDLATVSQQDWDDLVKRTVHTDTEVTQLKQALLEGKDYGEGKGNGHVASLLDFIQQDRQDVADHQGKNYSAALNEAIDKILNKS